jgi:hypothetical protein
MKKTILAMLMFGLPLLSGEASAQDIFSKQGKTSYAWEKTTVDVGKVTYKTPKVIEFKFKNTGEVPIAIIKAEGSCGCTQIDYPHAPVKPGETITVKATYDAASKGAFSKSIKITLSNSDFETLYLKGVVE